MNKASITRIFSHIPNIETEHLLLRRIMTGDYRDMFEYARQQIVTRYLLWEPHEDENYTYRYLSAVQQQYREGTFFDWAVTLKSTGKMIGTCGFTCFSLPDGRGEIGYVLNPAYWGNGIIPEAVMAVLSFGFDELKLTRIEAKYIFGNDQSRRVMEKCGMKFEGVLRSYMYIKGEYRDIGICSILSQEFRINAGNRRFAFGRWHMPLF